MKMGNIYENGAADLRSPPPLPNRNTDAVNRLTSSARSKRAVLRAATDPVHGRLDRALSAYDLADVDGYRAFLLVHAAALIACERALKAQGFGALCSGWSEGKRTASLLADLRGLDATPPLIPPVPIVGADAMWGAAYVLEGSRMGARVLERRARAEGNPLVVANLRFLSHRGGMRWGTFVNALEDALDANDGLERAIEGALIAFGLFENAEAQVASVSDKAMNTGGRVRKVVSTVNVRARQLLGASA